MWVWASIMPGSTVALERSRTAAPAGIDAFDASETLSIKFPRITMTCSRRGAADFPSIRTPARMTVTAVSPVTKEDSERASRKTDRRGAIRTVEATSGLRRRLAEAQHRADGLAVHLLRPGVALQDPAVL